MPQHIEAQYQEILNEYVKKQTEQNLYVGQNFSRQLILENISPEEVISMHKAAIGELYSDLPDVVWHSFDFLIEMMINYGLALQERQSLLKRQEELKVEMDLAANVQETANPMVIRWRLRSSPAIASARAAASLACSIRDSAASR